MARKNEELLRKLSALKPSTPTRTRAVKATKGKALDGTEKGSGGKKASGSTGVRKAKPSAPGAMKRKAAPGTATAATGKKPARSKSSLVKAVKVVRAPEPAGPIGKKAVPETAARLAGGRDEAAQPPPVNREEASPASDGSGTTARWNAWKAGLFQAVPGADWGAFGEASNAVCQEASRFRQLWFDGLLRCTRLMIDVADLHWKVMLGLGRPWTGGR